MVLSNATVMKGHTLVKEPVYVDEQGLISDNPDVGGGEIDCNKCLVMPGLVNCHGHTAMTLLRSVGAGLPLQRWLEEAIFPLEAKMRPEDIAAGMTWGAMEMLSGGTTMVADMYDFPEAGAKALAASGMKGNLCRVGLAFSDTEEVPPNRLKECIDFVVAHPEGGKIVGDFCIHSEYLTKPKFCKAMAEANKVFQRPVHVHVSETEKEHQECIKRHGKTPIRYLADMGLLDYGGYAAHCVWVTDDDLKIMRDKRVTLVHNPTSNLKLGSGIAPIVRAKELGVNVALGTDGCASNDNLNMFEEMHLAGLLAKGSTRNPAALSVWDLIDMATINGAKALGREDTGVIAPGKQADLIVIDLKKPHLYPVNDIASLVVNSMQASDVIMTIVGGEVVYNRGVFKHIDVWQARENLDRCLKSVHSSST